MFGIKSRKQRENRKDMADMKLGSARAIEEDNQKTASAANTVTGIGKVRGPGAPSAKSVGNVQAARQSTLSQYRLDYIPEGVIIKRVFPRKGVNQWMVRFHSRITEYYAPTLDEAITELFKNQPVVAERYEANRKEGR